MSMILQNYEMTKLVVPTLDELLREEDVTSYPYEKSYGEAKDDPIFVLHTSGSTGLFICSFVKCFHTNQWKTCRHPETHDLYT